MYLACTTLMRLDTLVYSSRKKGKNITFPRMILHPLRTITHASHTVKLTTRSSRVSVHSSQSREPSSATFLPRHISLYTSLLYLLSHSYVIRVSLSHTFAEAATTLCSGYTPRESGLLRESRALAHMRGYRDERKEGGRE